MSFSELQLHFGAIDIYLFDQLLRSRITPGMRIFDAGCGSGRNLVYFLRQGYEVFGVDRDVDSVEQVRQMAAALAPDLPPTNFRVESIEKSSFPESFADLVISSAVLHFAEDDDDFNRMLAGTWRALKPGGLLFCRLASSIGMEKQIRRVSGRRFLLPDGSERYLVNEAFLIQAAKRLGGRMIDPLKTTIVQNERSMTTWVVVKES